MEFSTFDKDNDAWSDGSCADDYDGANWWGHCGSNNMNGKYGGNGDDWDYEFMWWIGFNAYNFTSLKSMTLMFRRAD